MSSSKGKRKRQTRLSLAPIPSSSPAVQDYHSQVQQRAAAVRYGESYSPSKKRRTQDMQHGSREHGLATPDPTSQIDGSTDWLDAQPGSRKTYARSQKRHRQQRIDFSNAEPSSSVPLPATATSTSSDDSDDDVQPVRSKRRKLGGGNGFMSSQASGAKQSRVQTVVDDLENPSQIKKSDSDDDEMPTTQGMIRKRRSKLARSSPVRSSPPVIASSDEEDVITPRVRRSRQAFDHEEEEEDLEQEDSDDLPVSTSRRLKRGTQLTNEEKQELDSDLEYLGNTSDVAQPRSTQSKQKSARAAALEALKRKRSGQPLPSPPPAESDDGILANAEESSDIESDNVTAAPTSSRAMFQSDEDDEEFLDDDEAADDTLGVPENVPIEFTRYASMKAKDLFKHAIEWMVQKKINPAFRAEDELYGLAFQKLNDEISGLVNSKFSSSAWTVEFRQALIARPEIDVREMGAGSALILDHCEACNRKGHPASYEVRFHGKPYHPESLDDVDEDDSESSDEETQGDRPAVDYRGNRVPPSNKVFHVGRFCMANAETAHELQHWKKHLYDWVVEWLHEQKYTKASKIVERDSWSTKKRRKHANKIADKMNEQGVVRNLWKEFSDSIQRARNSQQKYR